MTPDLKQLAGRDYRCHREEGALPSDDPWSWIVPCYKGHIYCHGDETIGVALDVSNGEVRRNLETLGFRVTQDEGVRCNMVAPASQFQAVATLMDAKRRKRISEEHLAKLLAASANTRFKPGRISEKHGCGSAVEFADGVPAVPVDVQTP